MKFNFRFLAKQKIRQRLTLMFGVLLAGFVLIGIAYTGASYVYDKTQETDTSIKNFGLTVETLEARMLQARRDEKDFLLRLDDKYLAKHDKTMAEVVATIDKADALAPDDEAKKLLADVRANMTAYQKAFKDMAANQVKAGLDQTQGLQGALRQAVHEAEDLLAKNHNIELTVSMLQMRRHEKDFLARHDDKDSNKYVEKLVEERRNFARLQGRTALAADLKATLTANVNTYHSNFLAMVEGIRTVEKDIEVLREAVHKVEPVLDTLSKKAETLLAQNATQQRSTTRAINWTFTFTMLLIAAVVGGLVYLTIRAINRPLITLKDTLTKITGGDNQARAALDSGDELQDIGDALDKMMDDRGKFMKTEEEMEQLNDSIIAIMRALAQLARGDLTVSAPVREDITGALSDAINHMAQSMTKTLSNVDAASEEVRTGAVKSRETVVSTAKEMDDIRATIQETAKRIKRLGERSQEIGGIVKLIDDIAERTSVLALNANMKAAEAGEAGRGFRVVADEVQRLAERSKQATDQIAKLVNNIQAETTETTTTMDRAISEVVKGGELAEKASSQVTHIEQLADDLLKSVRAFKLPGEHRAQPTAVQPRKVA